MPTLKLEQLRVYTLAEQLADHVWNLVGPWDRMAKQTVGIQLIRAADSIGANIAEGYGRGAFADNRRFVKIARGSLYEVRHFLRRADRRALISRAEKRVLHPLINELAPTLNGYLKSIGSTSVTPRAPIRPRIARDQ